MNINNISSLYNATFSLIRSGRFLAILALPQVKIAAVAFAALGCLAATYKLYQYCSNRRKASNPADPKLDDSTSNKCRDIVVYSPQRPLTPPARPAPPAQNEPPARLAPPAITLPSYVIPIPQPQFVIPESIFKNNNPSNFDPRTALIVYRGPAVPREPEAVEVVEEVPPAADPVVAEAAPTRWWNRAASVGIAVLNAPVKAVTATGNLAVAAGTGAVNVTAAAATGARNLAVQAGTTAVYVKNVAVNVGGAVVGAAKQGIALGDEAIKSLNEAQNGINLYPIFKRLAIRGQAIAVEGRDRAVDFLNAPATQYDPVTANFLHGLTSHLGPKLHYLLLNAATLNSPALAQHYAVKMNLVGNGAVAIGDFCLKLGNPCGLMSLLVDLTSGGVDIFGSLEDSVLTHIEKMIDDLIIKDRVNEADSSFMRQYCRFKDAQYAHKKEIKLFLAHLEELGITPPDESNRSLFDINWRQWWEAHEDKASPMYHETKQIQEEETRKLKALEDPNAPFSKDLKRELKARLIGATSLALKNTLRQTLTAFTMDLIQQINVDTGYNLTNGMKEKAKGLLLSLILGQRSEILGHVKKAKKPLQVLKKNKNIIQTIGKPVTMLKVIAQTIIPASIQTKFIEKINRGAAPVIYDALAPGLEKAVIEKMGLDSLQICSEEDMKIDLKTLLERDYLSERKKKFLGAMFDYTPGNMNKIIQNLIQQAGKKFANVIALKIATYLKDQINQRNALEFTAEDLMNRELELPRNRRVIQTVGIWTRGFVVDQIEESRRQVGQMFRTAVTVGRAGGFLAPAEPRWDEF